MSLLSNSSQPNLLPAFEALAEHSVNLQCALRAVSLTMYHTDNDGARLVYHAALKKLLILFSKVRECSLQVTQGNATTLQSLNASLRDFAESDEVEAQFFRWARLIGHENLQPPPLPQSADDQERLVYKYVCICAGKREIGTGFHSDQPFFAIMREVDKQVKELIAESFPEMKIPRIVFTGPQSSGKSVVAQRFLSLGVFPSALRRCTLYPTEVRLRGTSFGTQTSIEFRHPALDGGVVTLTLQQDVILSDVITQHVEDVKDIIHNRMIDPTSTYDETLIITITSLTVSMDIDVVDLPGYLTSGKSKNEKRQRRIVENAIKRYVLSNRNSLFVVVQEPQDTSSYGFLTFLENIEHELKKPLNMVFVITKPDVSAVNYMRAQETFSMFVADGLRTFVVRNPDRQQTHGAALAISYSQAQIIEDRWFFDASHGAVFPASDFSQDEAHHMRWAPYNWGMVALRAHVIGQFEQLSRDHFHSVFQEAKRHRDRWASQLAELEWTNNDNWKDDVLKNVMLAFKQTILGDASTLLKYATSSSDTYSAQADRFLRFGTGLESTVHISSVSRVAKYLSTSYNRLKHLNTRSAELESRLTNALLRALVPFAHQRGGILNQLRDLDDPSLQKRCSAIAFAEDLSRSCLKQIEKDMDSFLESVEVNFDVDSVFSIQQEVIDKRNHIDQVLQRVTNLIQAVDAFLNHSF